MDQRIAVALLLLAVIFGGAFFETGASKNNPKPQAAFIKNTAPPVVWKDPPLFTLPFLEATPAVNGRHEEDLRSDTAPFGAKPIVGLSSAAPPGVFLRRLRSDEPFLAARSAIVSDLVSGSPYFSLNADTRWPIASITKLMTAAVLLDLVDKEASIVVREEDIWFGGNAFTKDIRAGDAYRARDAIAIMLLVSSNEIAEASARVVGREKLVGYMNEKASEWGLHKTHFEDPTGISAANQSTARELVSFAARIREWHPDIFEVTQQEAITVTELGSGERKTFSNINLFAGSHHFLGGKTGKTPEAGANLLSLFSYGGSPIMIIVLGTEDRFGETTRLFNWFTHDFIPSR